MLFLALRLIFVYGTALKEYDDEDCAEEDEQIEDGALPTTVTKYVEATAGARFEIRRSVGKRFLRSFPRQHGIEMCVDIDGQPIAKAVAPHKMLASGRDFACSSAPSYVDGHWYRQKLRFSALSIGIIPCLYCHAVPLTPSLPQEIPLGC